MFTKTKDIWLVFPVCKTVQFLGLRTTRFVQSELNLEDTLSRRSGYAEIQDPELWLAF
jgi:hypothetical protein